MKKRILSILLTLVMVIGMLPAASLTAHAAGTESLTWNNETFTSTQDFASGGNDTLELTLVGDNKITISRNTIADHGQRECGLSVTHDNLIIGGTGTLTIKMNMTGVGNYVSLSGLSASNIVITDSAKVIIEVAGSDSGNHGISCSTISVEDNASIDITVTGNKQYETNGISAYQWASFTSKAESNITVYAKPDSLDAPVGYGVYVSPIHADREGNGNITVKNGSLNVTMHNPDRLLGTIGSALCSDGYYLNKNGVIHIENATVVTTIGDTNAINKKAAIASEAVTGGTITDSIIIKNSNVTVNGMQGGGIRSNNYGVLIENSNVNVTSSCTPGVTQSGSGIWAKEGLIINGNSDVSVTTKNYEPIIVSANKKINLSEGGKLTVEDIARDTFEFRLVRLGVNNVVTQGTSEIEADGLVNITAADNKFVVEYKESGSGEGGGNEDENIINSVAVTIPETAGATLNNSAIGVADGANYTVAGFYNVYVNGSIANAPQLVAGDEIEVWIDLTDNDGYTFASEGTATVNGKPATYSNIGGGYVRVKYSFTVAGGSETPEVTSITINPTSAEVTKGQTQRFTATVEVIGDIANTATWSVTGGNSGNTKIDATGLLTVGADETAATLTVIAKATADETKTATATVTVKAVYIPFYTVSVSASPAEGGTVDGGSTYEVGQTATVTAVAAEGYEFVKWTKNSSEVSTNDSYSFTVTESVALVAVFEEIPESEPTKYTVTYTDGVENEEIFADQTFSIEAGKATPAFIGTPERAGYVFKGWDPEVAETVTGPAIYKATWEAVSSEVTKYTVTVSGSNASTTGAGEYEVGETVTIYAGSRGGYTFAGWTSSNVTITNANSTTATFVMPDHDVTVTATWDKNSTGGGIVIPTVFPVNVKDSDNGEVKASAKYAAPGSTVKLTVTPDEGYELDTLIVKSGSKFIDVTEKNGKYQFVMPFGSATVTATFKKIETPVVPVVPTFDDVAEDTYYFDAVEWAVKEGITTGTSDTTFSPDMTCTRAQAVTFLWRAAGSPEPKSNVMPFEDVAAEAYYYKAVLWAVENGITKGTSATTFSPDADCTRAQIVTFLWRAQKSPAAIGVNPFTDVAADAYYVDAVLWAVEEKVTNGTSATTFSPDADCTRAQIVTFLYRALNEQ